MAIDRLKSDELKAKKESHLKGLYNVLEFSRTAFGGIPENAWPKEDQQRMQDGKKPRVGIVPDHPNV